VKNSTLVKKSTNVKKTFVEDIPKEPDKSCQKKEVIFELKETEKILTSTKNIEKAKKEEKSNLTNLQSVKEDVNTNIVDHESDDIVVNDESQPINNIESIPIVDKLNENEKVDQSKFVERAPDVLGHLYTAEEFRRELTIFDVEGDGNCLSRSLAVAIGLQQDEYDSIKRSILEYLKDNSDTMKEKTGLSDEDYKKEVDDFSKEDAWGGEVELLAFEMISGLRVVVYNEQFDVNTKETTSYICSRGLSAEEDYKKARIKLLFCRQIGRAHV
jgi:hypothetical protein